MKKKIINGIFYSSAGSFWWGVIGVFYFKYVSFAGTVELVVHRSIWTAFILFLSIIGLSYNISSSVGSSFAICPRETC